jgi:DNA-binding IclR family transcriptional regulator
MVVAGRRSHRGLSTARSALHVTWLLAREPEGVRADEVAGALGKSVSTAYNLLASLCDEGVAERRPGSVYRLTTLFRETVAEQGDRHDLSGVVDDLLARSHKRAYAAVVRDGVLRVVIERGLQGMPKLPGMSPLIRDNAHALALGKVVLALSPPEAVERYLANGLRPFTPSTITTREELDTELREIRRTGIAVER